MQNSTLFYIKLSLILNIFKEINNFTKNVYYDIMTGKNIFSEGNMLDFIRIISEELKLKKEQVDNTVKLLDDGGTVPFISRYRKEMTGSLDEEVIRSIQERIGYLRNLEKRKEEVLNSIEEQGKLTDELKERWEK